MGKLLRHWNDKRRSKLQNGKLDGNQLSEKLLAPQTLATDGVLQHPSKPKGDGTNIYEGFTSAQFGTAGRWMTTNLAARAYDTNITAAILPAAPNGELSDPNPQWCYTSATSPTTNTEYMDNKDLGLLYNWAAVTGCYTKNDTNEDGIEHPIRQGICPNGWHVPSEKEWSELEAEFTANKSKYSSLANDGSANYNGKAMKDVSSNGASKPVSEGGFAILLASYAFNGRSGSRSGSLGSNGYLWSSSSCEGSGAWCSLVGSDGNLVGHAGISRNHLFSVRCKEDTPR